MTQTAQVRELPRLTSLRALAALAVFGFHLGHSELRWRPAEALLPHGYAGVAFFFVLSGFVLMWAARPHERHRDFYQRRFARVWPNHAATAILAVLMGASAPPHVLVPNLLGVHAWTGKDEIVFGINAPSWSLSCEMFFYACFPLVLWLARRSSVKKFVGGCTLVFAALAALMILAAVAGRPWQNVAYANPAARLGEFLLGIALAKAVLQGWRPRFGIVSAVAVTLASAALSHLLGPPLPLPGLLLLPGFCMLVAAAATADLTGTPGVLAHAWLVRAGQLSFAFYLVHSLVIDVLVAHLAVPQPVLVVAALSVASLGALALHEAVERPCQRWLSPRDRERRLGDSSATSAG